MTDGQRHWILGRLSQPGTGSSDMPRLNDSGSGDNRLTQTQYDHMNRWSTNTDFTEVGTGVTR